MRIDDALMTSKTTGKEMRIDDALMTSKTTSEVCKLPTSSLEVRRKEVII